MALFLSTIKLNAAISSMHQLCPAVRTIFVRPPDDAVAEAATVFLYNKMAQEVFGKRFAAELRRGLRDRYRHQTAEEIDVRLARLAANFEAFRAIEEERWAGEGGAAPYAVSIRSLIRALLTEAGEDADEERVCESFPRLETAVTRVRDHLAGIRRQPRFVMRK